MTTPEDAIAGSVDPVVRRCKRCGNPFKPRLLKALKKMSECCEVCGVRNLCDGLDLPTPPELLDRHTKLPALTRRDFFAQLAADVEPPNADLSDHR